MRRVEEVLAAQVAALRAEQGLSQSDLAELVRLRGLAWTRATVAAVETGRRQLLAVDLVVLASAFCVSPATLLVGAEDAVGVGEGEWSAQYVRAVVADGGGRVPVPATYTSPALRGRQRALEGAIEGDRAHRARLSKRWGLQGATDGTWTALRAEPGSVEQETARRLRRARPRPDVDALDVVLAAAHGWGRSLLAERELRLAREAPPGASAGTLQALRGRISRGLDKELLDEISGTPLPAAEPKGGEGFWGEHPEEPPWLVKYLKNKSRRKKR